MDSGIEHHGIKGRQFGPPRTISNKVTGAEKLTLAGKVPDKLLKEIKEFLENMNVMPEQERMKKCYELMRKINNKLSI